MAAEYSIRFCRCLCEDILDHCERKGVLYNNYPVNDAGEYDLLPDNNDDAPLEDNPLDDIVPAAPEAGPAEEEDEMRKYLPDVKPAVADQQEQDVEQLTIDFGV